MTKLKCPIGRDAVKDYLPHREPILLVDRVVDYTENNITTEIDLSDHKGLFEGHFPERAILPGVYMIEMAAQAGALLVALNHGNLGEKFLAFSGVDKVKFRRPVKPNEIIRVEVELVNIRRTFYKFSGILHVGNEKAMILDFSAAMMEF